MSREQDVRDAVDRFLARVRRDTDARLEALATDLLHIAQGDMRTSRVDVERAAVEVARAVAKGGSHARHDLVARIVIAVRHLDDATTLSGILDALSTGIAAEASRAAVFVVAGGSLQRYRHYGFAAGEGPVDLAADASPILRAAIHLRQVTTVAPAADRDDPNVPAFMRVAEGHLGLVMPLVVGGDVVALVYVEGPDRRKAEPAEPGAPVWSEQVEVLVRHAAVRLENVTSQRTVEVLTSPS